MVSLQIGTTRGAGSPDTPTPVAVTLVDVSDPKAAEVDVPDPVRLTRQQAHRPPGETFADVIVPTLQSEAAVAANPAHEELRPIVDIRQPLRIRPLARPVAAHGRCKPAGFVRPLEVIDLPPGAKRPLGLRKGAVGRTLEELGLQRPVEAFLLALGLRMEWPAMADIDPQLQEPDGQARQDWPSRHAPGPAVARANPVRQAVAP